MRTLSFTLVACALAAACGRGNGSTTPMNSRQPLVSVVGCVTQTDGALVLTAAPGGSASTPVGTSGRQGSGAKATRQYRLIDEAHTGVDRYVDRQVQITGKVESPGSAEAAMLPAIRVTQLNSLGGCDQK